MRINGQEVAVPRQGFLTVAFVWMFVGVLLSAGAAYVMLNNEALAPSPSTVVPALLIAQFAFVIVVSAAINRIGAGRRPGALLRLRPAQRPDAGVIVAAFVASPAWPG